MAGSYVWLWFVFKTQVFVNGEDSAYLLNKYIPLLEEQDFGRPFPAWSWTTKSKGELFRTSNSGDFERIPKEAKI